MDYIPPVSPNLELVFGEIRNPYTPPVSPFITLTFGEIENQSLANTPDQSNFMIILTQ